MRGRVPPAKRKPCAIPLCPALRKKGSYVCSAHAKDTKTHHSGLSKQPKAHKFGAVATIVNGIRFDSKAEAERYQDLLLLEKAGAIRELRLQTRWPLHVNGVEIASYVSDFDYFLADTTARTTEDTKGMKTPMYRLKKKWMKAEHGIDILET